MKICLVTTFPPSQGGLSEYGLHIAHELQRNPFIRLTVLADTLSSPRSRIAGIFRSSVAGRLTMPPVPPAF